MSRSTRSRRRARTRTRDIPERVYSAAEVAGAMGISKMTVLRCIEDGRLLRPGLFPQLPGYWVWLWNAREFRWSLAFLRAYARTVKSS